MAASSSTGASRIVWECSFSSAPSLVSERFDRIHARRAPRRNVARPERNQRPLQRHADKATGVEWRHTERHRAEKAGHAERAHEADADAKGAKQRALTNDEPEHVRSLCAERDSHTDLLRTLRDRVRDDTVNAHRREN